LTTGLPDKIGAELLDRQHHQQLAQRTVRAPSDVVEPRRGTPGPQPAPRRDGLQQCDQRTPGFARAFAGRWRITETDKWDEIDCSGPRIPRSSGTMVANWYYSPSKPISMSVMARATVRPATSSHRKALTTAARQRSRLGRLGHCGRLVGHLFIHTGDDLGFVAERE
jgi:hypothetical protein